MNEAEDVLSKMSFVDLHRSKLRSTDPGEHLNRDLKQRVDVGDEGQFQPCSKKMAPTGWLVLSQQEMSPLWLRSNSFVQVATPAAFEPLLVICVQRPGPQGG